MKPMHKLIAAGAMLLASQAVLADAKWDFPTAYPASSFHTENINQFVAEIGKATGG
jgi:hypothetical protein